MNFLYLMHDYDVLVEGGADGTTAFLLIALAIVKSEG